MERSLRSWGLAVVVAAVLGAGCTATVSGEAYGPGYPGGPDLVAVSPGVSVIADYDEPIFYSDGFYWRNYGGGWYRSTYYTGGWVYAAPPAAILRIDRPYAYRHYRPQGWRPGYASRPAPYAGGGSWRGAPAPAPAARPQPYAPGGGWRGRAAPAPAPVARPLTAPPRTGPAPAPQRPRPPQGRPAPAPQRGGWRPQR